MTNTTEDTTHNADGQSQSKTRLAAIIGDKSVSDKRHESLTIAMNAGVRTSTAGIASERDDGR